VWRGVAVVGWERLSRENHCALVDDAQETQDSIIVKRPTKPKRKPLKRGPKEERLVITDAETDLAKLVKKPPKH
jgi:hypothetical protein